jgi:hypothetical protein
MSTLTVSEGPRWHWPTTGFVEAHFISNDVGANFIDEARMPEGVQASDTGGLGYLFGQLVNISERYTAFRDAANRSHSETIQTERTGSPTHLTGSRTYRDRKSVSAGTQYWLHQ